MKTIGLLGGMSWVSTALYYRLLNEGANRRLGRMHAAKVLIKSFDYQELTDLNAGGKSQKVADELAAAARQLESIGADVLAIGANTMHMYFEEVQAVVKVPVIHVAESCGKSLKANGVKKAGLLGTRLTMEGAFYRERLAEKFDVETVIPCDSDRITVERVIREELTRNLILDGSRQAYVEMVARLADDGAEAVILGCTEIGLLIKPGDVNLPAFDTTVLHAEDLLDFATA